MTAIQKAREALDEARIFIAAEYADASAEVYGEWLASEARPVFSKICIALAALDAETPATPADVGEEPVAWTTQAEMEDIGRDVVGRVWKNSTRFRSIPLYSATALERVVRDRDEARANAEIVCNSYADENQRLHDRAESAEAKLAEALARLETVEAETRKRCARELSLRRLALDHQTEVLDIAREMGIYDICIEAIRNLEPRQ